MVAPSDTATPDHRATLVALLDTAQPLPDPYAIAAALKDRQTADALDAAEFARDLRLRHSLASAVDQAALTVSRILGSASNPAELRRAANSAAALARASTALRALTIPTAARAVRPEMEPSGASQPRGEIPSRPATRGPSDPVVFEPLPCPRPADEPEQIVAAQIHALRSAESPREAVYLLNQSLATGFLDEPHIHDNLQRIFGSPAWTRRDWPYTISDPEPTPSGVQITVRFTPPAAPRSQSGGLPPRSTPASSSPSDPATNDSAATTAPASDAPTGSGTIDAPESCLFLLRREPRDPSDLVPDPQPDDPPNPIIWRTFDIRADSS